MKLTATSDGNLRRWVEAARRRLRALRPATHAAGAWLAREARRRAPRGDAPGRRGSSSLSASIGHRTLSDDELTLVSPLPYARIQAYGGGIRGGSPRSKIAPKPRYLAVPLTDEARRLLGGLGASQSLRRVPGLFVIRSKAGRLLIVRSASRRTDRSDIRKHRFKDKTLRVRQIGEHEGEQIEVLFVLTPSVQLQRNPPPRGYVPSLEEPEVRRRINDIVRKWVLSGRVL